jgi:hypothetical protein
VPHRHPEQTTKLHTINQLFFLETFNPIHHALLGFKALANRHLRRAKNGESVFNVLYTNVLGTHNHSNHVEAEDVARSLEARHPNLRRTAEFPLLTPAHLSDRTAERIGSSGLHLDERHRARRPIRLSADRNQVDVPVPILKASLGDFPPMDVKPLRRDGLATQSHLLPRRRHAPNLSEIGRLRRIRPMHSAPKFCVRLEGSFVYTWRDYRNPNVAIPYFTFS